MRAQQENFMFLLMMDELLMSSTGFNDNDPIRERNGWNLPLMGYERSSFRRRPGSGLYKTLV